MVNHLGRVDVVNVAVPDLHAAYAVMSAAWECGLGCTLSEVGGVLYVSF